MATTVNTAWLLDYLEPRCGHDALLKALPNVGLEVEEQHAVAAAESAREAGSSQPADDSESRLVLNVLPNRPDCLGLIGIAREVAAFVGRTLRYPSGIDLKASRAGQGAPVELREPGLCPRYTCQIIRGVKVGPSPDWLKAKLLSIGARPINNVVDVTNYILYEWGQPLHAFDYSRLEGGRIVVRKMAAGEKLELLNGKMIDGAAAPLVIADGKRPIALAGIMGGRETETSASTADVLLEAACFDPVNIRQTVKRIDIGLEARRTESSFRFERGTDPNQTLERALACACRLIVELAGGKLDGPCVDEYPTPRKSREFQLGVDHVSAYLGLHVDASTIRERLTRLEMRVTDDLRVTVPTWRVDVNDPVVLIEDIARLVGYDKIPTAATPSLPTLGERSLTDRLREAVAGFLAGAGFFEARNAPLESKDSAPAGAADLRISIKNPATRDMSVLRDSLLPGLLRSAERNLRRGAASIRLFEIDRVFTLDQARQPSGRWTASGVAGGALQELNWRNASSRVDFFDAKGVVQDLLEAVRVRDVELVPAEAASFAAGAAATILSGGQSIGRMGEVAASAVDVGKTSTKLFAFELDLEAIEPRFDSHNKYHPLVRTPAVTRDLAIVVPAAQAFGPLESALRAAAGSALESLLFVDQYQGTQVAAGHKSLAFRLVFRDPGRTLAGEDVSATMDSIVRALHEKFGAQLRA